MKVKFLIVLHIIICCLFIPPQTAFATAKHSIPTSEVQALLSDGYTVYARVNSDTAYLFSDNSLTDGLFKIPRTFYLKVFEVSDGFCRVAYCYEDYDYARAVYGYADCRDLLFTDTPPSNKSFPNVFLTFEGNGTFYKNNRFDNFYSIQDSPYSDVFFYGYYLRGTERFCYVFQSGKFGYYSDEVFEKIEITPHPDAMPSPHSVAPQTSNTESVDDSAGFFDKDTNKIIFIAVSCIIAVCAVYLIFLPRKEKFEGEPTDFDED